MIEVISNGIYPKQCTCENCQAVLSYYGVDIQSRNDYKYISRIDTIITIHEKYIECPQCGYKIILERPE